MTALRPVLLPSYEERRVGKLKLPHNLRVTCGRCGSEVTFERGEMYCLDCPISYQPIAGGFNGARPVRRHETINGLLDLARERGLPMTTGNRIEGPKGKAVRA